MFIADPVTQRKFDKILGLGLLLFAVLFFPPQIASMLMPSDLAAFANQVCGLALVLFRIGFQELRSEKEANSQCRK